MSPVVKIATRDFYAEDALGVRRYVAAGTVLPPGVTAPDDHARDAGGPPTADAATGEGTYMDDALGVRRHVAAGDELPIASGQVAAREPDPVAPAPARKTARARSEQPGEEAAAKPGAKQQLR